MEKKNHTVLIIDDERDIAEFVCGEIESTGIECKYCDSVEEAKEIISDIKPLIILSDLRMPNGGGEILLKYCKELYKEKFYFYFLTGNIDFTEEMAVSKGGDGTLYKPIDFEKLHEVVKKR
jgi:DNA-binding NtrC family response regulator